MKNGYLDIGDLIEITTKDENNVYKGEIIDFGLRIQKGTEYDGIHPCISIGILPKDKNAYSDLVMLWTENIINIKVLRLGCEMKKAVLLMDIPKDCSNCDFEEYRHDQDWGDGEYCQINGGQCTTGGRPSHCPLKELPEYMKGAPIKSHNGMYKAGYNACLDDILEL